MSILGPNNDYRASMSEIGSNPLTPVMTREAAQTIGYQEELNRYADGIADEFVRAKEPLVEKARAAKKQSIKDIVDGRIFKFAFTVYEAGFALAQQWSDMES